MNSDAAILGHRASWQHAPVLAVCFAVIGVVGLHWQTAASIVAIWVRSETFAHGFVVAPICMWLVWRRRDALARIAARPWWPGLVAVSGAGALWLVMSAADVLGVKQFAFAFMLQAAIVTVVGTRVARSLAFPLAFLLFAIPAGEILVPTLIDWTADFTVAALRASGVPVYREANHFIIPSGAWSVVEACSGVRYLIASVMVGTIYAAVAYRSTRRRVLFVVASVLVPIVANWLRAYMIVMIGHLSNNKLAVGVDHIIYGWVFFGLVMLLLFWVGSFWQEEPAQIPAMAGAATRHPAPDEPPPASAGALFAAAIAAVFAAGIWLPIDKALERPVAAGIPVIPAVAAENGWAPSAAALTDWKPHYRGYAAELRQAFQKDGQVVGLYIAYYRHQEKGRELITSGNLLTPREDWNWKLVAQGRDSIEWNGRRVETGQAELSADVVRIDVFQLFWVNGHLTASEYAAKAWLAWTKLAGHGDDSALIVFYAPMRAPGDDVRGALRSFAQGMSPAIEQALDAARASSK